MMSALSSIENPKVLSVFPIPCAWHSVHIFPLFVKSCFFFRFPLRPECSFTFPAIFPGFICYLYVLRHIPHKIPVSGLARPRVFSIFASAALSSGVKFFMRCNSLIGRAFRPLPRFGLQIFPKKVAVKFGGDGKSVYFCTRKSGTALRCRPPESSKEAIFERFT